MNLSDEQKAVVYTEAPRVVVIATAAAGKTATLVERSKYLLSTGIDPAKIVLLTFTNAAADELSERIGRPNGMYIGTVHSYANYLLKCIGLDTDKYIEREQFDKLFEEIDDHPECIRPVTHLMLDEAQDSNREQINFIFKNIKPKNYMLVGDYRQSIYGWNGAYPEFLVNLADDPTVTTYDLSQNYRNGKSILQYAKNIINLAGYKYADRSVAMRDFDGRVVEVEFSADAIARAIKQRGNYKDWFILTRTNAQIDDMIRALTKYDIPADTFKRASLDNADLYKRMRDDKVKVLTIHTSKGLEAPNVVVVGAKFYNLDETCLSYVAATRARDLLVWTRVKPVVRKTMARTKNWET